MTDQSRESQPLEITQRVQVTPGRISALIRRLARAIDHELPSGDIAQLRRLTPQDPGCPAFWRLVVLHLEPSGELPVLGSGRDEAERRWAALLAGMALMKGLHQSGRRPGLALAAAGYSELRFVRLLRARGEALAAAIRGVAQLLASKAEPVDWTQLAGLVRDQDGDDAEKLRRGLARDYYGAPTRGE